MGGVQTRKSRIDSAVNETKGGGGGGRGEKKGWTARAAAALAPAQFARFLSCRREFFYSAFIRC